jgi:hypothetical protein
MAFGMISENNANRFENSFQNYMDESEDLLLECHTGRCHNNLARSFDGT